MIDRNVVSVAAPEIQREFGLTNTQLGLAFSVFGFPYLLQAPVGWLCDKWGSRLGLTIFGSIWSLATIFCGLSSSLAGLVGARALLGLGEAAPFPAMTRVIADWTPPDTPQLHAGPDTQFRLDRYHHDAAAGCLADGLCGLARRLPVTRRHQRRLGGGVGLALP